MSAAGRVLWYSAPHQDWDITNGSTPQEVTITAQRFESGKASPVYPILAISPHLVASTEHMGALPLLKLA